MADVAHIEIDRFLIEEKLDSGLRKLSYVLTEDQGACCLTEGLSSLGLSRLSFTHLEGSVENEVKNAYYVKGQL